jgi:hypothetical protein
MTVKLNTTCGKVIEIENEFLQYAMEKLIWKAQMSTSESTCTPQQGKHSAQGAEQTHDSKRAS